MRFRKKPVVIDALPFDGTVASATLIIQWAAEHGNPLLVYQLSLSGIYIPTREGTMVAEAGDWIIRGVAGEFYPCKPDIFAATYDAVSEAPEA
jgi:hypothetical protein